MDSPREIWLISGEASGDLYGARIAEELRKLSPDTCIAGMGGVKMKAAGVEILVDSSELGVIGIVEVMAGIFKFIKIFLKLVRLAKERRPAGVILIDYPGFNIRFAKQMKKLNIPVVWYISPQVWAWRKGNIKRLAQRCRKMLAIFPFEPQVYEGSGLDVEFVGHPLVDIVEGRRDPALKRDSNRILILPGSRKNEIAYLLEPFLKAAVILHERHPELEFVIAAPRPRIEAQIREQMEKLVRKYPDIGKLPLTCSCGETAKWMQICSAGLAASGTVTVECAIARLPLVVAYRLNWITFLLALVLIGRLFRGHFTMTDIILDKNTFHEFLQFQVVPKKLASEMEMILPGGSRRSEVEADMETMVRMLTPGAKGALAHTAERALDAIAGRNITGH